MVWMISRPFAKAASWATSKGAAALSGAIFALGHMPALADFHDGLQAFDAGDYETALAEWRPAAAAGDADAQLALAGMYRQGVGVRQDWRRAIDYYLAAARQGHVSGQLNLGDLFVTGQGVPRDLVRGYAWLLLAARQEHAWAIERLAQVRNEMNEGQIAEADRLAASLIN